MPVSTLDSVDSSVAQLFLASRHSLDPATADFMLRRIVPVTIYIEGDDDDLPALADYIRNDVVRIIGESGYSQVGEWGPFSGSFLTTIFFRGDQPERGASFQKKILELRQNLSKFFSWGFRVSPPPVSPRTWERVRAVLVVGEFIVQLVGPPAVAAMLPVAIPAVVIEYIALTAGAGEAIHAIRVVLKPDTTSKEDSSKEDPSKEN